MNGSLLEKMAESQSTDCIFCKIIAGKTETEFLYEDESFVSFKDIRPDAPHHYLVIPKSHTPNVRYLTADHIPVVEKLEEIGREVLKKQFDGDQTDCKIGFHWPPFTSVPHLHLHVLAPQSQMGLFKKTLMFNSMAFVSTQWTINFLKGKL